MTTVRAYRHDPLQALAGGCSPMTPSCLSSISSTGQSLEEVQQSNSMAFTASEAAATISAMNFLNLPVEIEVVEVVEDSAASSSFEPGDTLTAVNDTPVTTPGEVQEMIRNMAPGDEVTITYLRGGEESSETVTLGAHPQDPRYHYWDLHDLRANLRHRVSPTTRRYRGPSAGLMFSWRWWTNFRWPLTGVYCGR